MSAERLDDLFGLAHRAVDEGVSTADFEPAFTAVLDFIQMNPDSRERALSTLLDAVHGRNDVSWELLAFLMHELRWPEVREEAVSVIRTSDDWRVKTPMSHVVAVFDDDWPDADMYQRWRKPDDPD